MKPRKSFAIAAAIVGVVFSAADLMFAIEKKPPKVSAKESFRPNALRKLAVIVTGPQKSTFLVRLPQSDQQRLVEDQFLGTLIDKNYDIAVRSDLEKILGEQQLQKSGLTDTDSAEIGRLLNVPAVMLIHITEISAGGGAGRFGGRPNPVNVTLSTASLGARLIDVKTGSVLWTGTHRVEVQVADPRSSDALIKAADELAEVFPKRDADAQKPDSLRPDAPERSRRPGFAFTAGSVWQGTQTRVGDDAASIDIKWVVKERNGDKFRAEVEMPMRTLKVEGTVSGGTITWRNMLRDGGVGPEQTLRIRGRTITGRTSRTGPDGKMFHVDVSLTLKQE